MTGLVLGPMLRHVDEHAAVIWVETESRAPVVVEADGRAVEAFGFTVHGHHYAVATIEGLEPGRHYPYTVRVDDEQVWPEADSPLPPSVIPTLDHGKPLRLAFGSCRTSVGHDAKGNGTHGVDALRAYALRMARVTEAHEREEHPAHAEEPGPGRGPGAAATDTDTDTADAADPQGEQPHWPDLVLFLGDQVYADETTEAMREFISSRRDIEQAPWTELQDYEEYAHLYWLAWSDPVNRWLLSTLPSLMIFDDHDIRDDWNTSQAWREEMAATEWWHDRIVGGLASYWVYQHLGNLTPAERKGDEVWQELQRHADDAAFDAGAYLDDFAERADEEPTTYRWSYTRDFGDQARLVVIDTRAARVLEEGRRAMLDEREMRWLDEQVRGDVEHLLIGTSLPFLLAPGLHYVEAFSEALAGGAWGGGRGRRFGERMRTFVDLEHWAAFQNGFQEVAEMVLEVARGERGRAPGSVTFLSGDVHHSYLSEAQPSRRSARAGAVQSRILQAVCSPIRNPLSRKWRFATAAASYGVAAPIGHLAARSSKVPDAPLTWRLTEGPWFDNNLATLEITDRGCRFWWATGEVEGDDHEHPTLVTVSDVEVHAPSVPGGERAALRS